MFENNVGKEENVGHQHFLIFTQRFLGLPFKNPISKFGVRLHSFFRLQMLRFWTSLQFCLLVEKISLVLSQTKNFRLFHAQRVCRRQFDEHCRKFLRAESFHPHFFKRLVLQTWKFYRKRCKIHINCMTVSFNSCKVLLWNARTVLCCYKTFLYVIFWIVWSFFYSVV